MNPELDSSGRHAANRWQPELANERISLLAVETFEFLWTDAELIGSPAFERFRPYLSDIDAWLASTTRARWAGFDREGYRSNAYSDFQIG